jgi:hypothetical protein
MNPFSSANCLNSSGLLPFGLDVVDGGLKGHEVWVLNKTRKIHVEIMNTA